jgi:gluconate kinase
MPEVVFLMVFRMANAFDGPVEARQMMPRYYGYAEANAGFPLGDPDRESWLKALGRRVSSVVAASVAAVQRL